MLKERCYDVNLIGDVLLKIQLIRQLEKDYNISVFNLNGDPEKVIKFNEKTFKLIKKAFRNGKTKPQNMYDLLKLYVQLVKNVCGNDVIATIDTTAKRKGDKKTYQLNEANVKKCLMLHAHKNHNNFNKFRVDYIEKFELCTKKDEYDVFMF